MQARKEIRDLTVGEIIQQMTPKGLQHFEIEFDKYPRGDTPEVVIKLWDLSILRWHRLSPDSPMPDDRDRIASLEEDLEYHGRQIAAARKHIGRLAEAVTAAATAPAPEVHDGTPRVDAEVHSGTAEETGGQAVAHSQA